MQEQFMLHFPAHITEWSGFNLCRVRYALMRLFVIVSLKMVTNDYSQARNS